jgi:hypothetical protein
VKLPAAVAGGYAASLVPTTAPVALALRVGVVFLVVSVVALGPSAALWAVCPRPTNR